MNNGGEDPRAARCPTGASRGSLALALAGVALVALLAGSVPATARAEVMLFRGTHVYVVPIGITRRLLQLASRDTWRHFDSMRRSVDLDGDGRPDYHAIALGAQGGYGAQIRYRLLEDVDPDRQRLGRWYWGVVTGPDGAVVYEAFNP